MGPTQLAHAASNPAVGGPAVLLGHPLGHVESAGAEGDRRHEPGPGGSLPPVDYDLRLPVWQRRPVDVLLDVNVLHVTPWAVAEALFAGAGRILRPGGPLAVYGPFPPRDAPLAGRLLRLDRELRAHDPALGVRVIESLDDAAVRGGLRREAVIAMPEEGDVLVVYRAGQPAPRP